MKIHLVGAELFHADGQTDMLKLTVGFRIFANGSKNGCLRKQKVLETKRSGGGI